MENYSAKSSNEIIELTNKVTTNYNSMPVVMSRGEGVWVYDVEGNKYLDCLAAYSAVNQGHCHPKVVAALKNQAEKLTLSSRAFHNDVMAFFLQKLCKYTGFTKALPMNSGAEGVETALKIARKWGYTVKKVPLDKAEIIVCDGNFHGRTTTVVSFSSEEQYKKLFGPLTPGFKSVPYGDANALKAAITPNTVGFLLEPIQGEGGVNVPPEGYLANVARICKDTGVLMLLDEIQTGFGRTGKKFCGDYDNTRGDILIMGKALSAGMYPISAVCCNASIMDVIKAGDHGSTYGGNPLASAVGIAALEVLEEENLPERSFELGKYFRGLLAEIKSDKIKEVRGKGLMIGIEIKKEFGKARPLCEELKRRGILCKETHEQVIRITPPLIIEEKELKWVAEQLKEVLA